MNAAARPITRTDLESKFRELQGGVGEATEKATSYLLVAGAAAAIIVIGGAYLIGRRRGQRKSTVVEVRRL